MPYVSPFGSQYLDTTTFKASLRTFGCKQAVIAPDTSQIWSDTELSDMLAIASRAIESQVAQTFGAGPFIEQHHWNTVTRRITVNDPPVLTVTSFAIRVAPGTIQTFDPATLYINNQENWIELASLALGSSLTPVLLTLGMFEPVVEITYTSAATVPQDVVSACGYEAAARILDTVRDSIIAPGLAVVKAGDVEVRRDITVRPSERFDRLLSARAEQLLSGYNRISLE